MQLSRQDLAHIVAQAMPLLARLESLSTPSALPTEDAATQSRWERWRTLVARGDETIFARRLAWDGLSVEQVQQTMTALQAADLSSLSNLTGLSAEDTPLPAWAEFLQAALKVVNEAPVVENGQMPTPRFIDPTEPLPYEDLFIAFVESASVRLQQMAAAHYQHLAPAAHSALERSLLRQLTHLCAPTLDLEFSLKRAIRQTSFSRLLGQTQPQAGKTRYLEFVQGLLGGKFSNFFREYTVLARLVGTALEFWVAATAEFLERLAVDLPTLQVQFGDAKPDLLGQVTAIQPALSDRHHQGRTVMIVHFANGCKLVYKPKNLGLDVAYHDLLAWLNAQGAPLALRTLQVYNRETYGWVECVEHLPCATIEEAQQFYTRAGMLLCLLYVLEATDCHYENLIAAGPQPVLIDVEALLHPRAWEDETQAEFASAQFLANDQLWNSVLRTSLLPEWGVGPGGQVYDGSGLGAVSNQETQVRVAAWRHVNADRMERGVAYAQIQPKGNVPFLFGVALSPNDYVEDLVAGFRQMYGFLCQQRAALLQADSPLARLGQQPVRFIFRATKLYATLLQRTLKPNALRSGLDRSIELDVLSRALLATPDKPPLWPLLEIEVAALEQGDIPYFAVRADSLRLDLPNGRSVENGFRETGYQRALATLQRLNPDDLELQTGFIRASLYSRVATGQEEKGNATAPDKNSVDLDEIARLSQAELLAQVEAIAAEIQRRAIRAANGAPDGSAVWIGLWYTQEADRYRLQPLGYDLYTGSCGVAFFLAAFAQMGGNLAYRDLALGALEPLRRRVVDVRARQKLLKQLGPGGAVGVGSLLYGLARVSQFTGEAGLLDDARALATLFTPETIRAEARLDVMTGIAGTLLGLLALYRAAPDPAILATATACGQHLVQNRMLTATGHHAWRTLDEKPATGMSHGAAGIAYTLLQLYAACPLPEFLSAAQEAIAYEAAVFVSDVGNWPDFGAEAPSRFMTTWCHGAPGIGLARLGGLSILDTPAIRQDITAALQTTHQVGVRAVDHLCCGNWGRIDLFLLGAQRLGQPAWLALAQKQAAAVVHRAQKNGGFTLFPELPTGVYYPALFRGTAGIGYELLRLAYPELLPSVLLWE